MTNVLVVDDEPDIRRSTARILERRGYQVSTAGDGEEALARIRASEVDLILTDVSMPGLGGLGLLEALREDGILVPTLVMSGAGTIADAVRALQLGANDFLEKPVSAERLIVSVQKCLETQRLKDENAVLRQDAASVGSDLLGEGPALRELRGLIGKVAPTEGRVLITGENGSGKELVAAAIHRGSARRDGPFIKLNCSAVPRDLVESELFGHERGAFTGAVQQRKGRFELADGGTLFLDEIGDMPLEMQTKLLRVLQEGQIERVGGSRTIDVDVRVLAATHRDLEAMVREGAFREDLYYRLNVVHLRVPPLRERRDDVPLLARHFLERAAKQNRRDIHAFAPSALAALARYDFPGNVRELQNLVERLVILADEDTISLADVERALGGRNGSAGAPTKLYREGETLADLLDALEKRLIEEAIEAHGNRAAAARALEVERSFFYKKCKRFGIEGD
ncbi:MAG: sigma-54-dependent Fis family transcriptional regulator [Myxococcales bacterium]|nr:sigma-54-dependent Fis family transcriptional regulator [Myxococcales bacterium]